MDDQVQTVEIIKQPGQTLGFYIREGNGVDRWSGVFVSRIAQGSVVAKNNLLRVNDEILNVNSIDVQRMSLDDVVILMSIARRLVLTIRVSRNYKSCNQVEHAEVISPREQAEREGRQPVVVLKSGFNSSSYSDMSVDERAQERLLTSDLYSRQPDKQMMLSCGDVQEAYNTNPRYNVTQMSSTPMQSLSPRQLAIEASSNLHFPQQLSAYSPTRIQQAHPDYPQEGDIFSQQMVTQFGQHRRTPSDQMYCTMDRTSLYRGHDWMDGRVIVSDTGRMMDPTLDRTSLVASTRIPQSTRVMPNGRVCQIDQYNSDSEATPRYQKSKNRYRNFTNQMGGVSSEMERNQAMLKSMTLSRASSLLRKRTSGSFADLSSLGLYGETQFSPSTQKLIGTPYQQASSISMPMPQDDYNLWLNRQLLQYNNETIPNAVNQYSMSQQPLPNYRLTRKLSTDSLIDYKTYQMEGPSDFSYPQKLDNRLGSWISSDVPFSKSSRQSATMRHRSNLPQPQKAKVHTASIPTTSATNAPTSGSISHASSKSANTASKSRGNQLSRIPIKIQTEQFVNCPSEASDACVPVTGSLKINILCGHGLKSTKTALRDLYCVVEIDSMPVARTMVRTGALNFDWDEQFDIDVVRLQKVQFLVYSWDPDTRHQLCFTAAAPVAQVLASQAEPNESNNQQPSNPKVIKLAIKLDPKGTLYVEISFTNVSATFSRSQSSKANVFGVDLKEIVQRERSGSNVPLLVQRCVREIERRGVGQLGLYRLSGSTRRKQQLKEEFEKNVRLVDLSADGVSDVNVLTSVLRDYFKELPEPLCSNSLYEMLLDALSVQMPGDFEGNTQLMLGILECLPRVNQDTLAFMLDHLKRVAMKLEINKMTTQQLGICLGPALICPALDDIKVNMDFDKQAELLRCLLDIWQESGVSGGQTSTQSTREKVEDLSQEHWTHQSKLT